MISVALRRIVTLADRIWCGNLFSLPSPVGDRKFNGNDQEGKRELLAVDSDYTDPDKPRHGENIVVDGVNLYSLEPGTRIQVCPNAGSSSKAPTDVVKAVAERACPADASVDCRVGYFCILPPSAVSTTYGMCHLAAEKYRSLRDGFDCSAAEMHGARGLSKCENGCLKHLYCQSVSCVVVVENRCGVHTWSRC